MERLVESVREYGVLHPGVARPRKEGGYELIAGHRRKHASRRAGKETMPVFIRDYDDDEATIIMVDSNLQREEIRLSEKAHAYRMKYDALKHQGKGGGLSLDEMGKETGENWKQVQRIIRLSFLNDQLADFLDEGKIKFNSAVELSYLSEESQDALSELLAENPVGISVKKAQKLKELDKQKSLSAREIQNVIYEKPTKQKEKGRRISLEIGSFQSLKDMSSKDIEDLIVRLLEEWDSNQE